MALNYRLLLVIVFSDKERLIIEFGSPILPNIDAKDRHKKRAYMLLKRCKPFINLGRYIQTRTGDLYDVNVAL